MQARFMSEISPGSAHTKMILKEWNEADSSETNFRLINSVRWRQSGWQGLDNH